MICELEADHMAQRDRIEPCRAGGRDGGDDGFGARKGFQDSWCRSTELEAVLAGLNSAVLQQIRFI